MVRKVHYLVIVTLGCWLDAEAFNDRFTQFIKGSYHTSNSGNSGEPLLLTKLLEAGKYAEARNASLVSHPQLKEVESYSGFLTVDPKYNSNLYFWYFPAKNNRPTAPVLVWLQGGPGASSLVGLFEEHGPFRILPNKSVGLREFSWHQNHHMIYIDNPVGSGFSFTEKDEGYATNESQVGENLYKFIRQFFVLFPDLLSHPFYIAGESYGGKYVPAFGHAIQQDYNASDIKINLQGLAIGDGYTDPINQLDYGDYLFQLGLIDANAKQVFDRETKAAMECIKRKDMSCANRILGALMDGVDGRSSFLKNATGLSSYYNYLQVNDDPTADNTLIEFLQDPEVRRAMHVGSLPFQNSDDHGRVAEKLANDRHDTVAPWVSDLLSHYRVLFYNGQLDIICAYPLTVNVLSKLPFEGAAEYKVARREIYRVDGEIAGYVKKAGKLQEMMIRNAGHMVPRDQPKWAFDMISAFTHQKY